MKASQVIKQIQKLIDRNGDREFNIYKSFSKETTSNFEICYDDVEQDIYIGVYA